jgi:hypothetical protein
MLKWWLTHACCLGIEMEPSGLCFWEARELSKDIRELELIAKVPKIEVL